MNSIPNFMLGVQLFEKIEEWMRVVTSSRYWVWLLLGGMLLIMVTVGFLAYAFYRFGRRHHHHHHRHHHHRSHGSERSGESDEEDEERPGRRHRRRRREHRPRNPTLAETGGLPPIRQEGPGPAP